MTKRLQLRWPHSVGIWPVVRVGLGRFFTLADLRKLDKPIMGALYLFELDRKPCGEACEKCEEGAPSCAGGCPLPSYPVVLREGRGRHLASYSCATQRRAFLEVFGVGLAITKASEDSEAPEASEGQKGAGDA